MQIYGQLGRAALENLAAAPSGTISGRIWWDTVALKTYIDDGTNKYAFLRNDGKAVFGNNGTANNNIRFHRGANSVIQFVLGGDTTAEGTLSTSLAQYSGRHENYTTGSLPAVGNAGRVAWDTTVGALKVDNGAAWGLVDSGDTPRPYLLQNIGLATSVAANALTIALKQFDGSTDATSGSPIKIATRDSTVTSGAHNVRSVTGALSVVVPSGATLGHPSGSAYYIYVYAIDNAGTIELAVSSILQDERELHSTTAISAAADDSGFYSTTARSNVAIRLLGRLKSSQTTAGTWATGMSEVSLTSFNGYSVFNVKETDQDETAYAITAGNYGDSASLSLEPGDWEITAIGVWLSNGVTTATLLAFGVSTTSGNSSTGMQIGRDLVASQKTNVSGARDSQCMANLKVTVTTTTTYYLKTRVDASITNIFLAYRLTAKRIS